MFGIDRMKIETELRIEETKDKINVMRKEYFLLKNSIQEDTHELKEKNKTLKKEHDSLHSELSLIREETKQKVAAANNMAKQVF